MKRKNNAKRQRPVNSGRHEAQCSICVHPERESIEGDFISWRSVNKTAATYKVSRDAIYRHANAKGLLEQRRRNVRAALERIIERADDLKDIPASAVVAAVSAYARINAQGQFVERTEMLNVNSILSQLTQAEALDYAKTGQLPDRLTWPQAAIARKGERDEESA